MVIKKLNISTLVVFSIFGTSFTSVYAEDGATRLETVSVTTSRIEKTAKSIPNTVTIINQEQIQKQMTINDSLSGILEKMVPGFAPSSQKMAGRSETLRGKNPAYMIDGVPQHNSLRDGQRDGYTIDPDFLERIEVINGANAIQGIGATGGVIGMTTKTAKENGKWNNELKTSLTSGNKFNSEGFGEKITYIGSIKKDKFDFVGGIAYQQRGLFFDANGDKVGMYATQGDIMDTTSRDIFLKFGFQPDENQRIQLMINDYEMEKNGDYEPVDGNRTTGTYTSSKKGDPSSKVGDPAKNDVTTISLDYSNLDLLNGEFRSQLYFQDYAAKFEGGTYGNYFRLTVDGGPYLDQSEIQSKKHGLKLSYAKPELAGIKNFIPLFGFDYSVDESNQVLAKSNRKWVPDIKMTSYAPFLQFDYMLMDDLLISTGARYESATLNVDDYTTIAAANSTFVKGGEPDFNELLKNVGLVYNFNDIISGYASYAEGFDMADIGRVLRAIKIPNQDVDNFLNISPVITKNKEIGLDIEKGQWKAHIAYFKTNTNLGSRLDKDENDIYHVRREKQEISGIDFTTSYIIDAQTSVGMSFSQIDGEYDSDGDGSVDTDLDGGNISPDRLMLFADATIYGLDSRLQISHLLDKTTNGLKAKSNGSEKFEGYNIVDLYLAKATSFGKFSLGVENFLDEDYETYFSQTNTAQKNSQYFAGRGRSMTLTYQVEF